MVISSAPSSSAMAPVRRRRPTCPALEGARLAAASPAAISRRSRSARASSAVSGAGAPPGPPPEAASSTSPASSAARARKSSSPLRATLASSRSSALPRRSNAAPALLDAVSTSEPNVLRSSAASLGSRSSASTSPRSSIFPSSAVVTPIARAAIWKAPGNRSPSCPLSSSACTVPLEMICWSAVSTPPVSPAERPITREASATATKMSRAASPSSAVPRAAAANPEYECAALRKLMPSRSVSALRNSSSARAACPLPVAARNRESSASTSTPERRTRSITAAAPMPMMAALTPPMRRRSPPARVESRSHSLDRPRDLARAPVLARPVWPISLPSLST